MLPALMMTPCTAVRFQNSRHQAMSYRSGSFSVMFVWPHRRVRRYQGSGTLAAIAAPACAATPAAAMKSRLVILFCIRALPRIIIPVPADDGGSGVGRVVLGWNRKVAPRESAGLYCRL